MYKSIAVISLFVAVIASAVSAQAQTGEIDPAVVSPDMYKVLLENEHVRVVEYEILPGQKDNWHTHPAKVSYVLAGGTLRISPEEGESFIVEEKTGSTIWFEAVGKHYGENVGHTPVRIVFVEIKGAESGREDISKYKRD
jgi:quercetin dioxygenase-like cupin family protein